MERELGIARCGLACCLWSENDYCGGCNSDDCPDKQICANRECSLKNNYNHCYDCGEECKIGLLSKIKPYGFTLFAKRYGKKCCWIALNGMRKNGFIYHRNGINGDYDDFDDVEELIELIMTGKNINKLFKWGE